MSRFQRGRSGNPSGRPRGAKTTVKLLASEFISDDDVRQVMATVIAAAKGGDMTAAGMVLDRVLPKLRPSTDGGDGAGLEELISGVQFTVLTAVPEQDARPAPRPTVAIEPQADLAAPPAPPPRPALRLPMGDEGERAVTDYDPHN